MDATRPNTDVPACPGCVQRDLRIAALEAKLQELSRAGKRQAAPFSKGPPKANPKTPGRKAGKVFGTKAFRAVPPAIDEILEAPLA